MNLKTKKTKVVKMTPEQFSNKYYTDELYNKFGEDWMEAVIQDLEREGIKIEFDYS